MIALSLPRKLAHSRCVVLVGVGLLAGPALMSSALAQTTVAASLNEPNVSARKIFIMLFLMLGPLKILVRFINLTRNSERVCCVDD